MKSKKIMLVAGEVSGDLHGAHLVQAIQEIDPEIQFFGVGGEGLEKRGMKLLHHVHSLSVVGISEAFRKLRTALKILRELKKAMEQERPDLIILIDYPEFNLRLAGIARKKGIPVLYYISPQIWAWRHGRVRSIAKRVRKMVVLFPFEVPLYEAAGVDVEWVGHPLLDIVRPSLSREEALKQFGIDPEQKTIALLPGSRIEEVARLLPPLLDSTILLRKKMSELQFIIPLAPGISRTNLHPILRDGLVPIRVVNGFSYDVMALSDLIITASGTATLEAAILGKPMVIVYKVSSLTYWVARALIRVKHIGLVNLVAGKEIAKELIQEEVNPERIAEEALRLLKDPVLYEKTVESMVEVRQSLGEPGAASRAARIVLSLLQENKL
ncbi:MAG: lipid-A-disaccharide synthase [Thermodesulfobacteriota bacterium]|nr:lipid-A-disaccharide synthase [Thermodesulfobacteriota bacterium]